MSDDHFSPVLNLKAVETHALSTASFYKCPTEPFASLQTFLNHPLVSRIICCGQEELDSLLCNDLYKPRMHNLYADSTSGVHLEFMLAVRATSVPLLQISQSDPKLWECFLQACTRRLGVDPYPPEVIDTLHRSSSSVSQKDSKGQLLEAAVARGIEDGVAPVTWESIHGELLACACGPSQSASHVETTLTQLVQEVTIAAQVRRIAAVEGVVPPSQEELLGNSLARLALGVDFLNRRLLSVPMSGSENEDIQSSTAPTISLFAGRRSSSRRYLLLQNLYCAFCLQGFYGTSSILAATLLPRFAQQLSSASTLTLTHDDLSSLQEALEKLHLVGTLAHEVPMALEQLLGHIIPNSENNSVNTESEVCGGQTAALLAHLLMLRANGGLLTATALPDTFGTRGFLETALVARIPLEFKDDMIERYPLEWDGVSECVKKEGAVVFDLFRVFRMDSGEYTEMASAVVDAWEGRWGPSAGNTSPSQGEISPFPPLFMHSNLSSYEEVIAAAHLPLRIRPKFLAFGTLADGFLPFFPFEFELEKKDLGSDSMRDNSIHCRSWEDSYQKESPSSAIPASSAVKLASVVMKVVQARHSSITAAAAAGQIVSTGYESAGKLGDDISASKAQVDRRLPVDIQERTLERLRRLAAVRNVDAEEASSALARAYHLVTRQGILR